MTDQTDPMPRGLLTGPRSVLLRLTKRYKVPLEVIADGNGERLRSAGGIDALLKLASTKDLADEPVSRILCCAPSRKG
jgi:hypothetical protein